MSRTEKRSSCPDAHWEAAFETQGSFLIETDPGAISVSTAIENNHHTIIISLLQTVKHLSLQSIHGRSPVEVEGMPSSISVLYEGNRSSGLSLLIHHVRRLSWFNHGF